MIARERPATRTSTAPVDPVSPGAAAHLIYCPRVGDPDRAACGFLCSHRPVDWTGDGGLSTSMPIEMTSHGKERR